MTDTLPPCLRARVEAALARRLAADPITHPSAGMVEGFTIHGTDTDIVVTWRFNIAALPPAEQEEGP